MNIRNRNDHDPAQLDEREWQAQESALRDERLGIAASSSDDPLVARYRPIAHALRAAPAMSLPEDFARNVACVAATQASPARVDTRLEQLLLRMLTISLAVSGVVALLYYGAQAVAALDAQILPWGLALATCMALTWSFGGLRRIRDEGDPLHLA